MKTAIQNCNVETAPSLFTGGYYGIGHIQGQDHRKFGDALEVGGLVLRKLYFYDSGEI
jgi:hypothetical protein